jgi:hypothetical protein
MSYPAAPQISLKSKLFPNRVSADVRPVGRGSYRRRKQVPNPGIEGRRVTAGRSGRREDAGEIDISITGIVTLKAGIAPRRPHEPRPWRVRSAFIDKVSVGLDILRGIKTAPGISVIGRIHLLATSSKLCVDLDAEVPVIESERYIIVGNGVLNPDTVCAGSEPN